MIPIPGFPAVELLRYAASADLRSEHPLAQAIVDGARQQEIELSLIHISEPTRPY